MLKNTSHTDYVEFKNKVKQEVLNKAKLFNSDKEEQLKQHFNLEITFSNNKYSFSNLEEFNIYINQDLYDTSNKNMNNLLKFAQIYDEIKIELDGIEYQITSNDKIADKKEYGITKTLEETYISKNVDATKLHEIIEIFKEHATNLFRFDEYVFISYSHFIEFLKDLKTSSEVASENFIDVHHLTPKYIEKLKNHEINNTSTDISKQDIKVGNIVKFGRFWQSDIFLKEPIEWYVIEINDEKRYVRLLSKNVLDSLVFDVSNNLNGYRVLEKDIDDDCFGEWEESLVYKWLNNYFLHVAFTQKENKIMRKFSIFTSQEEGLIKEYYSKINILNSNEYNRLKNSYKNLINGVPTKYALLNGAFQWESEKNTPYWVNSSKNDCILYSDFDSTLSYIQNRWLALGIRPCIELNLDEIK